MQKMHSENLFMRSNEQNISTTHIIEAFGICHVPLPLPPLVTPGSGTLVAVIVAEA